MRLVAAILILGMLGLYAASEYPTLSRCAVVLRGTVISNSLVRIIEEGQWGKHQLGETEIEIALKSELWRAEIQIAEVIKADKPLADRVFVCYNNAWRIETTTPRGTEVRLSREGCPPRPNVTVGMTKTFYCLRRTFETNDILVIPERGWITQ